MHIYGEKNVCVNKTESVRKKKKRIIVRAMRRTETIIMYSISKDTRVSPERRGVWGETSSLTFGYGLRDKLC